MGRARCYRPSGREQKEEDQHFVIFLFRLLQGDLMPNFEQKVVTSVSALQTGSQVRDQEK